MLNISLRQNISISVVAVFQGRFGKHLVRVSPNQVYLSMLSAALLLFHFFQHVKFNVILISSMSLMQERKGKRKEL